MAITTSTFPTTHSAGAARPQTRPAASTSNGTSAAPQASDTYTPGTNSGSLGILSPQQALAMKAKSATKPAFSDKDLVAAIKSHDYSNLVEQMAGMTKKREFVANFHKQHPAEYAALVKDIREGKVTSPSLKVAVALDTLNGTKWAKTPEGAKVAAHLGKLYDSGRISSMENPGGLGYSEMIGEVKDGAGRDGKKIDTRVVINHGLLNSPEAVATVLAHEGQHSYRASQGTMKRSLEEEVDAHTTQNKVWKEFGAEKYASTVKEGTESLDKIAAYDTTEKLYNRLAVSYTQDYVNKKNYAAARGVILDYSVYLGKNNFEPATRMSDDDLKSLLENGNKLVNDGSSNLVRNAVSNLQVESDRRAEANR